MIRILENWLEIGEANKFLARNGFHRHESPEKNWDLYLLYTIVESMHRQQKIIDLGCGDIHALKLLYTLGFKNLYGIDLSISIRSRISQIYRMWRKRTLKVPFHIYKRDLTKTKFPDQMFDVAICISVIEHGVNLEELLRESNRILKPGGILFITTDYWEDKIQANDNNRPFGLTWKVLSKSDIEYFMKISYDFGFSLYKDSSIPKCSDRCIVWNGHEFTFLSIVLRRLKL